MGSWLGKLWGKTSTKELLEKITSQLGDIETFNRDTQAWHKKLIGTLIAYFTVIYCMAIIFAYYSYYNDPEWQDIQSRLKLLTPFLLAPLLIFFLKRILTWWYHRKVRKNETQLAKLKKERTKILEDVMETETYKVAKELLDKYGPLELPSKPTKTKLHPNEKSSKISGGQSSSESATVRPSLLQEHGGNSNLRQRRSTSHLSGSSINVGNNPSTSHPGSPFRTMSTSTSASGIAGEGEHNRSIGSPDNKGTPHTSQMAPGHLQKLSSQQGVQRRIPGPPLPRPVLPRERGYMDRVVEYLVGDGPSNRYALICKQCQSHNGMALKEEFQYIAYRCCYCFYWNPARKQKPVAPKLQPPPVNTQSSTDSSSSEEDNAANLPNPSQNQLDTKENLPKRSENVPPEVSELHEKLDTSSTEQDDAPLPSKISDLPLENLEENEQDPQTEHGKDDAEFSTEEVINHDISQNCEVEEDNMDLT
jgi:hypothetical protein